MPHGRARSRSRSGTARKSGRLEADCITTIRIISAEQPSAAKAGHPGAAMGCAPIAHALWGHLMRYSPKDPKWPDRDRFVLSNGHACALQYTMLHLSGYDLQLSDLENFRRLHSKCPGHPENFMTPGVEVVTGPLGQGLSNVVGMALARAHMAARYNKPDFPLFTSCIYAICGDGCLMEGITSEAAALAGRLQLSGLVVLYDDNQITIDGSTNLAFTEDVGQRFEAYGWEVTTIPDGDTDLAGILSAIANAKESEKPCLIKVKTTIGYGSEKANTAHIHGTPLGAEDLQKLRKTGGGPKDKAFHVSKDVEDFYRHRGQAGDETAGQWRKMLEKYAQAYPAEFRELHHRMKSEQPAAWWGCFKHSMDLPVAAGDGVLAAAIHELPEMLGGSVSSAPPLGTSSSPAPLAFTAPDRHGRHVNFGPGMEHAAAAICVGIASFGSLVPYWRCSLDDLPNAWGAIRLSALGQFPVLWVATYDTGEATEVLALCRATPNLALFRPADATEVAAAYSAAVVSKTRPTVVVLPPPGSPKIPGTQVDSAAKGGYTLADFPEGAQETAILVATGEEVLACLEAQALLAKAGEGVRVVSLPCWELFEEQSQEYQHLVLQRPRHKHIQKSASPPPLPVFYAEAAAPLGSERFAAVHLATGGGPADICHHKLTAAGIVEQVRSYLKPSNGQT